MISSSLDVGILTHISIHLLKISADRWHKHGCESTSMGAPGFWTCCSLSWGEDRNQFRTGDHFYQVSVFMADAGQQTRDNMTLLAQPPWGLGSCKTCQILLDNTDYPLLQMMSTTRKGYKTSTGVVYRKNLDWPCSCSDSTLKMCVS